MAVDEGRRLLRPMEGTRAMNPKSIYWKTKAAQDVLLMREEAKLLRLTDGDAAYAAVLESRAYQLERIIGEQPINPLDHEQSK